MIDAPDTTALDALPDDARAWLYITSEPLPEAAARHVANGLGAFFRDWRSHGRIVHGAAEVVGAQAIVVAATLDRGDISGCGIDQHVRVLDSLLADVNARHADTLAVAWTDDNGVLHVGTRAAFRAAGDVVRRLPREAQTLGEIRPALAFMRA